VWRPRLRPLCRGEFARWRFDISKCSPPCAICASHRIGSGAAAAAGERIGDLAAILANTTEDNRDVSKPWLADADRPAGCRRLRVTFAISLLERVIEEQARGAPERAAQARAEVESALGGKVEA